VGGDKRTVDRYVDMKFVSVSVCVIYKIERKKEKKNGYVGRYVCTLYRLSQDKTKQNKLHIFF